MLAIIRIRGTVKAKKEMEHTLQRLRLNRKMHCIIAKDEPGVRGMLQKAKDYITWGEIDDDMLKRLIEKRGRKPGDARLGKEEALAAAEQLASGKKPKDAGIKAVFRLSPPSKGFRKSIKQHYPNGELGYRGKEINELLMRMI